MVGWGASRARTCRPATQRHGERRVEKPSRLRLAWYRDEQEAQGDREVDARCAELDLVCR